MNHLKILIVEDEFLIGLQLEMELSQVGYVVIGPVATGDEAVSLAQREEPDVVVLDIRLMGAMDGIEAARQIGLFSAPRIIFTTGYTDPDLKKRAMTLNPLAYLIKPVDWRDIDAVIRARLSSTNAV